eukprot:TRINITY_DN60622_c0_g1_i3.p1 TRINITY_DN60622_c0_g1~~TRINITY_DN60622_c0_g1_i3.p1  ORF type:complete len:410 (-),score=100.92 TRINITY_DN60622_c0_g1_i3:97-1326(-)
MCIRDSPPPDRNKVPDDSGFERVRDAWDKDVWTSILRGSTPTGRAGFVGSGWGLRRREVLQHTIQNNGRLDLSHPHFQRQETDVPTGPVVSTEPTESERLQTLSSSRDGVQQWLAEQPTLKAPTPDDRKPKQRETTQLDRARTKLYGFGMSELDFQRENYGAALPHRTNNEQDMSTVFGSPEAEQFVQEKMGETACKRNPTFGWMDDVLGRDIASMSASAQEFKRAVLYKDLRLARSLHAADIAAKLYAAAARGDAPKVRGLLAEKCDPDATSPSGATALWVATYGQREAVVDALLEAGADPRRVHAETREDCIQTAVRVHRPDLAARLQRSGRGSKSRSNSRHNGRSSRAAVQSGLSLVVAGASLGSMVMPSDVEGLVEEEYAESFGKAVLSGDSTCLLYTSPSPRDS